MGALVDERNGAAAATETGEVLEESRLEPEEEAEVEAQPETEAPMVYAEAQRWLLAGPAGSGRTALLGSVARACSLFPTDEVELDLRAENEAAAATFGEATRRFMGELRDDAPDASQLTFSLGVRRRGSRRPKGPLAVTVEQVRGWDFPAPLSRKRDPKRVPQSEVLVLVVPPRELSHAGGGDGGRVRSVAAELDDGLSALAGMRRPLPSAGGTGWLGRLAARRSASAPRKVLPFGRVLVLVSMVDRVATDLLGRGAAGAAMGLSADEPLVAREVVEAMGPLAAARHYVGDGYLVALLGQVAPDCKVAVGLVSSSGFRPSGEALLDGRGRFTTPGSGLRFEQDAAAQTAVLREWAPWGIRAALVFAATGEVLEEEPLTLISMDQFDPRDSGGE
jgi:hypothetical protein